MAEVGTGVRPRTNRQENAGYELGITREGNLTYDFSQVTAAAASGVLLAADTTNATRTVTMVTLSTAAVDANGACAYIDADQVASSADFPIFPGVPFTITTADELRVIRAGASDVTVFLAVGSKA